MTPFRADFNRSESAFHQNLTREDRQELLKLQTLREIPKSRYATQLCITGLPSGHGRKVVYSHVEVYKMVEAIATELREAGVRPQTICAFILHNSIESIVYFQALQWIGAIAVPIDPNLSEKEIALVLKETSAFTLVSPLFEEGEKTDDTLFRKIEAACSGIDIIQWYVSRSTNKGVFMERMDRMAGEGAAWAGGSADFKYDPSETSLRLATPDGENCLVVDMSHRSLASAVRDFSNTYNLTAEMSTLLFFPFHDMHGLMCALATIYSGGNIFVQEGEQLNTKAILKVASENDVTWFSADAKTVLEMHESISNNPELLEGVSLSFIRSVNGTIDADTMRTIEPILRVPVLEAYGTAETCVLVAANQDMDFRPGTCGRAVGGCKVLILDDSGSKLQAGEEGNIAVYGPHICRGYLNSDYANEKCFIEVHDGNNTKRFFLTGDKGCLSNDGYLKVTGAWLSRGRAAVLAAEEDEDIRNRVERETAMALQLAEEKHRQEEEREASEDAKHRMEDEEAKRRMQEEEGLQKEEEEGLTKDAEDILQREDDENSQEEANDHLLPSQEGAISEDGKGDGINREEEAHEFQEEQEDELSRRTEGENMENETTTTAIDVLNSEDEEATSSQAQTETEATSISVSARSTTTEKTSATDAMGRELLQKIIERLDRIELNQRRLEDDIEAGHRLEMERIRLLIEQAEANTASPSAPVNIDMSAINSAVTSAAASAQRSSQDTAAAVQAAKEAAAAAAEASTRQAEGSRSSNVVAVNDPNALQKTVLVSLEDVEKAMMMHPAVATARAFGRPDKKYGMEVYCAINPKTGARVSEPWLKLHAQTALPPAFVPKKFFFKEDLREDEDRASLANNNDLKRMSHYSGFSTAKTVKAPEWSKEMAAVQQKKALERIATLRGHADEAVDEDPARIGGTAQSPKAGSKQ